MPADDKTNLISKEDKQNSLSTKIKEKAVSLKEWLGGPSMLTGGIKFFNSNHPNDTLMSDGGIRFFFAALVLIKVLDHYQDQQMAKENSRIERWRGFK